jgi:hypothetical protein
LSLRVLITNYCLDGYTGTEIFVRDLALELKRQGHIPIVYASSLGGVSKELSTSDIPVTTSLKKLDFQPDIIHGHFRYETLSAISRFPDTPAIYFVHDYRNWLNIPPRHSHIFRYFGVSELCQMRLRSSGIPENKIGRVYNFVDIERYTPRGPLPEKPHRALVFSNYATPDTYLPAVIEACRVAGLDLDVVGDGVGKPVVNPETILGQYDIVFAKSKAAMEAMAVGNAVVLCDFAGVGPMITTGDFMSLREMNFGYQSLTEAHTAENLLKQINRYDPSEAFAVRDMLRTTSGLERAVADMVSIYTDVISEYKALRPVSSGIRDVIAMMELVKYPVSSRIRKMWANIPKERRLLITKSRGFRMVEGTVRRILTGSEKWRCRE